MILCLKYLLVWALIVCGLTFMVAAVINAINKIAYNSGFIEKQTKEELYENHAVSNGYYWLCKTP